MYLRLRYLCSLVCTGGRSSIIVLCIHVFTLVHCDRSTAIPYLWIINWPSARAFISRGSHDLYVSLHYHSLSEHNDQLQTTGHFLDIDRSTPRGHFSLLETKFQSAAALTTALSRCIKSNDCMTARQIFF